MPDIKIFRDDARLGAHAAGQAFERLSRAGEIRGHMTLGCPSGRSPRSTYAAMGRLAAARRLDLSGLHLLLMDEFVVPAGEGWVRCPPEAHYSCARFGEFEIRRVLNAGLPPDRQVPPQHLHAPDPNAPADYESLIDALGGIDVFILASGATDGHVAFNPAGTPADALTRVVRLSDMTRRDNMATFPAFDDIDAVPLWGVTVGPATIARASRSALMILSGAGKAEAFRRIAGATGYESDWPATILHDCADAMLLVERSAVGVATRTGAVSATPP